MIWLNPIEQLAKIFKIKKNEINDNLMNTTISKIIEFSQIPTYEEINNALEKFNKRDYVEIYLKDESEESITIASNKNNVILCINKIDKIVKTTKIL